MKTETKKLTTNLFGQMLLCGLICGIVCGGAGVLFAWATTLCDKTFHANDWLIFLLPAAGIVVVLLYDKFRAGEDLCTDALFRYLHGDAVLNHGSRETNPGSDKVSIWLAPLIFISTNLAYLFGGSVGRVGSALQLGGTLGIYATGWIGGDVAVNGVDSDAFVGKLTYGIFTKPGMRHVPLACGMAAGFCAILNAPVAGAFFGVEVLILSGSELIAIIPAAIASFITWGIAKLAQVPYTDFHFEITGGITRAGSTSDHAAMASLSETGLAVEVLLKVAVVALAATLAGRMFCYGRTVTTKGFGLIQNKYIRVIVGAGLVIAITLIAGVSTYNGIGFDYVDGVMDGRSAMFAFAWKLALTLFTLGCGIRGGEIAPTIFIGATSCFALGCLIGLDPTLAAAMGFVGALASVTNCPISIGILGLEAICCSGEALIYFAITAIIAHLFSGTYGLYHEQTSHRQILKIRIP